MIRKLRLLHVCGAAAGAALAAAAPAAAKVLPPAVTSTLDIRGAGPIQRDGAVALRARWLASGHTVQELASLSPPAITRGSVDATTITVGAAGQFPSLGVAYSTDTPGLNSISAVFLSPSGEIAYSGGFNILDYRQSGELSFAIVTPLSLTSQPGTWTLSSLEVLDNAGNATIYSGAQLAALFTNLSFTVINAGPFVSAPPTILSGQLFNTTVSESSFPVLGATINANDSFGPGIYQAYVLISPPGSGFSEFAVLPNPLPVKAGNIKANNVLLPGNPTGTWAITGFAVCDYASNCSGSTSDASVIALFGTDSFTVTQ